MAVINISREEYAELIKGIITVKGNQEKLLKSLDDVVNVIDDINVSIDKLPCMVRKKMVTDKLNIIEQVMIHLEKQSQDNDYLEILEHGNKRYLVRLEIQEIIVNDDKKCV
jgi:hypothetical protein